MCCYVCLQVLRGGWEGSKAGYTLSYQTSNSNGSKVEQVPFSGLDDELTAFIQQVNFGLSHLVVIAGLLHFHAAHIGAIHL